MLKLVNSLRSEHFNGADLYAPATDTISFRQRFSTTWHIDACLKWTKGQDAVVQAGGNLGQWPIYLATRFKSVWTFEPSPINFQCLCLNTRGFDNIIRVPFGLGRTTRSVQLQEDAANCEGTYLTPDSGSIPVVSLDNVYPDNQPLDLLLLDLEGMEFDAIMGAIKTIERTRPVILIEYRQFERGTFNLAHLENYLNNLGYSPVAQASKDLIYVHRS